MPFSSDNSHLKEEDKEFQTATDARDKYMGIVSGKSSNQKYDVKD